MKLVKGSHITATEKKHIRSLYCQGLDSGSTKLKKYIIKKLGNNMLDVQISTSERDGYNRKIVRTQNVIVAM